ncbi:MAG: hypothetical protein WBE80_06670 [Methylocella sp.]
MTGWKKISVAGPEGLENVRTRTAQGVPLAYGTSLYTDFPTYDGTPNPYKGNGDIKIDPTTNNPAGHVLMIIGYDNDFGGPGDGAVLLRNSFGAGWGASWNGSGGAMSGWPIRHSKRSRKAMRSTSPQTDAAGRGARPPKITIHSHGG